MKITKYPSFIKLFDMVKKGILNGSTRILLELIGVLYNFIQEYGFNSNLISNLYHVREYVLKYRPTSPLLYNFTNQLIYFAEEKSKEHLNTYILLNWLEAYKRMVINSLDKISEFFKARVSNVNAILTHGYSSTVLKSLIVASSNRKFKVIVTETRPDYSGLRLARDLMREGINVEVIIDSSVRSIIRDVDLIVLGAEAIASDGAVINKIGSGMIAFIAREYRKRVLILSGSYKFATQTLWGKLVRTYEREIYNILPKEYRDLGINIRVPAYEEIPPSHIDAIITEEGLIPPKAFILLIAEKYPNIIAREGF